MNEFYAKIAIIKGWENFLKTTSDGEEKSNSRKC